LHLPNACRDDKLTQEEQQVLEQRVRGVAASAHELRFLLAAAVARNAFITKHGMQVDYGVSDDVDDNPLTQMNNAECLLALYMLHKEGQGHTPAFIDSDKLAVLKG
jgi:hypothetical protein